MLRPYRRKASAALLPAGLPSLSTLAIQTHAGQRSGTRLGGCSRPAQPERCTPLAPASTHACPVAVNRGPHDYCISSSPQFFPWAPTHTDLTRPTVQDFVVDHSDANIDFAATHIWPGKVQQRAVDWCVRFCLACLWLQGHPSVPRSAPQAHAARAPSLQTCGSARPAAARCRCPSSRRGSSSTSRVGRPGGGRGAQLHCMAGSDRTAGLTSWEVAGAGGLPSHPAHAAWPMPRRDSAQPACTLVHAAPSHSAASCRRRLAGQAPDHRGVWHPAGWAGCLLLRSLPGGGGQPQRGRPAQGRSLLAILRAGAGGGDGAAG